MPERSTERTVTFLRPFRLRAAGIACPPGRYRVVTDEVLIDGLTRPVWRRVATTIHIRFGVTEQVVAIDAAELESLLAEEVSGAPDLTPLRAIRSSSQENGQISMSNETQLSHRKFNIGQTIRISEHQVSRSAAPGAYEIVGYQPGEDGEQRYRIKSHLERHERIVREGEISRIL